MSLTWIDGTFCYFYSVTLGCAAKPLFSYLLREFDIYVEYSNVEYSGDDLYTDRLMTFDDVMGILLLCDGLIISKECKKQRLNKKATVTT